MKIGVAGANQITENYAYDSQTGFLSSQTVVRGASTLLNSSYDFAGANGKRTGQLVSISNNLDHNKDRKYEYDAVGRLKMATGGQSVNWAQRYDYDRYGNRLNAYSFTAEQYVRNFYQWGLNRQPTSTELQNWLSTLQTAYAQGQTPFLTAMQSLGQTIFNSQEYINRNRTDQQFVYDLYKTYLYREPDQSGWDFWTSQVPPNGRSNVRLAFEVSPEFGLRVGGISPFSPPGGLTVAVDGLQQITYDSATNRINNAGWTYDAVGNQVRAQAAGVWQVYQYDAANRLTRILADDKVSERTTYTYGDDSQRLISNQPGVSGGQDLRTYYVAEGGSVVAEYTEVGSGVIPSWSKSYIYLGPRLLSTLTPNGSGGAAVDYHHPDRLGTRLVTNGQNTNSFEQATLPFGTALSTETTGTTNRRFTSYDRSSSTNLDYAVNRHYDPQQGRFTQIDPVGIKSTSLSSPQTLNLYAYCANDPVNHADPSGLGFFSFLKKLFKGIAKVVTSKWFVIALTVALAVITIGSAAFGWKLMEPVLMNIGGSGKEAIWITVGQKATTLGWVNSAVQATLAVGSIGFSGRTILQNIVGFAAGIGSSQILSLLPSRNLGPGGTAPFGFQTTEQPLTKSQGDTVWNALKLIKTALDRKSCRDYVGAGAYDVLREMWDKRRITYFNGIQFQEGQDILNAGTTTDWLRRPRTVLSYYFFDEQNSALEVKALGVNNSLERQAVILLHEARHALCPRCGYIEPHDDWSFDIANKCFK